MTTPTPPGAADAAATPPPPAPAAYGAADTPPDTTANGTTATTADAANAANATSKVYMSGTADATDGGDTTNGGDRGDTTNATSTTSTTSTTSGSDTTNTTSTTSGSDTTNATSTTSGSDTTSATDGGGGGGGALPVAPSGVTWRWLAGELRRLKGWVAGAVASGVVAAGAAVVPAYALGLLVDRVRAGAGAGAIWPVAVAVLVSAVVGAVATGVTSYLVAKVGGEILAVVRERTVARALRLPVPVLERAGRGDLLSRIGGDVAEVARAVSDVIPPVIAAVLLGVLSVVSMAGMDWRLGLAGLVSVPLYAMALRWYLPKALPRYAEQRHNAARSSQRLVESLHGVRTVRAYGWEERHLAGVGEASAASRDVSVWVFDLFTRFVGRVNRAEFGGLAVILCAGFLLVRADVATVGEAAAAAVLFQRLFNPVGTLLFVFDEVQAAGASLARLVGVIELPEPPRQATAGLPGDASLEVAGIGFRYGTGPAVLHGLDVHVPAGSRVALVGPTGAGKSTLAAIAGGTLRPETGAVRIGGVEPADPRDHVVTVTQETHVFAGPLIEDLRLARPGASEAEARAALEAVGAWEWVSDLPEGLATAVGEGGHELTAARAQQLALARLVLADPPVAVLDEATAEAGSLGARVLEESALAATRGRTTLVVAHRLTQAAAADRVVLLEDGRITEEGPHADLLAKDGRYARLWAAWEGRTSPTTSR